MLKKICDEWARRGWLAVRYNLPYRRRRPKGPPSGSAATDQAGVVEAIELVARAGQRARHRGRPFLRRPDDVDGGRRRRGAVDVLTLFSYPLHPPGKPETRPHRTPAAHHGADGVHPRHRRPVRHDRRAARGRGARSPPPPRSSRSPAPATTSAPRHSTSRARGRRGATVALVTTPPGYPPPPDQPPPPDRIRPRPRAPIRHRAATHHRRGLIRLIRRRTTRRLARTRPLLPAPTGGRSSRWCSASSAES